MKYIVRDPESNAVVATYEEKDGAWEFWEANGPPYLEGDAKSKAPTLIGAILNRHRNKGRIISEEP